MTVKELRLALEQYPDDMLVVQAKEHDTYDLAITDTIERSAYFSPDFCDESDGIQAVILRPEDKSFYAAMNGAKKTLRVFLSDSTSAPFAIQADRQAWYLVNEKWNRSNFEYDTGEDFLAGHADYHEISGDEVAGFLSAFPLPETKGGI